jgi:hypothetical protein
MSTPSLKILPDHLFPPRAPQPETLLRDLAAIEEGDPTAVARVLSSSGKLVGSEDLREANAGSGFDVFVETLLEPDPVRVTVGREEAIELLADILEVRLGVADLQRALTFLSVALDQPCLRDLIFWPKERYGAERVYELATSCRGAALAPYLRDPPSSEPPRRPAISALVVARRVLAEMCAEGEIELSLGEEAALGMAVLLEKKRKGKAFVEWLLGPSSGVDEVFASDEVLKVRWESAQSEAAAVGAAPA